MVSILWLTISDRHLPVFYQLSADMITQHTDASILMQPNILPAYDAVSIISNEAASAVSQPKKFTYLNRTHNNRCVLVFAHHGFRNRVTISRGVS